MRALFGAFNSFLNDPMSCSILSSISNIVGYTLTSSTIDFPISDGPLSDNLLIHMVNTEVLEVLLSFITTKALARSFSVSHRIIGMACCFSVFNSCLHGLHHSAWHIIIKCFVFTTTFFVFRFGDRFFLRGDFSLLRGDLGLLRGDLRFGDRFFLRGDLFVSSCEDGRIVWRYALQQRNIIFFLVAYSQRKSSKTFQMDTLWC